ncbi:unnamed protein product [Spirodela intermedia]|uniref:Uncharacterized protein n=1 Tax=Spirodela intermedia TaxID=51605 RepID=A0A7I8L3C9_SPIIN|nr:unnamed protein product [Spirodela intermedia]
MILCLWLWAVLCFEDHTVLHLAEESTQETYYDVLCVEETASYEEIRAHDKAAVLRSHPAKLSSKQPIGITNQAQLQTANWDHQIVRERFLKIHKAWEVLSYAELKSAYDRDFKGLKYGSSVCADEVELKDTSVGDCGDAVELIFPCRCGDNLSITSDELEEMGFLLDGSRMLERQDASDLAPVSVTISCSSCSLIIWLRIDST